jgi:hypothetical protein
LSPFKPIILHKKSEDSINHFDFVGKSKDSPSLIRRNGLLRTHRFTVPSDIISNSSQTSLDSPSISQSTPELTCSNQSINKENDSSLSTNDTSLTNGTPTSNTHIDDKNEVNIFSLRLFIMRYDHKKPSYLSFCLSFIYFPRKTRYLYLTNVRQKEIETIEFNPSMDFDNKSSNVEFRFEFLCSKKTSYFSTT